MATMTLLEIVQEILSVLDSDTVNSISDTVEAEQVAREVKNTYFDLMSNLNVPSYQGIILLNGLADPTKPNYLQIPDNVKEIEWFKYNHTDADDNVDYKYVDYKAPEEFLLFITGRDTAATEVDVITDTSGAKFAIRNDKHPQVWTTFDNEYLVCDSYNSDFDTTLQQSKTLCWGQFHQTFTLDDSFVPELDDNLFPLLVADAKAACFLNIKQVANMKEERRARKHRTRLQNMQYRADQQRNTGAFNYGRVRRG